MMEVPDFALTLLYGGNRERPLWDFWWPKLHIPIHLPLPQHHFSIDPDDEKRDFWASAKNIIREATRHKIARNRVKELVERNPHQKKKLLQTIFTSDSSFSDSETGSSDLRFLLSNWVPNELTKNNKLQRVTCCRALNQIFNQYGYEFLGSNLLIQDETWVNWDSKTRKGVWASQDDKKRTSPRHKKYHGFGGLYVPFLEVLGVHSATKNHCRPPFYDPVPEGLLTSIQ